MMKNLFQNLIWPAVAGNVAWAFFNVIINESWQCPGVPEKIIVLLLLAIYLATDYTSLPNELLKPLFWVPDIFHSITIIVFAIAIQSNESWLDISLIAIFTVAAGGHISGLWEPIECKTRNQWRYRIICAGINLLGISVTIIFSKIIFDSTLWNLPIALALVLILWYYLKPKLYETEVVLK